jgi:hypothetical protein
MGSNEYLLLRDAVSSSRSLSHTFMSDTDGNTLEFTSSEGFVYYAGYIFKELNVYISRNTVIFQIIMV